jgi:hypothetical protein
MPRQSFTGSRPDYERRREIVALGAQGLALRAIGRRLNVRRQSVHQVLARCHGRNSPVGVQGRKCGMQISLRSALTRNNRRSCVWGAWAGLPKLTGFK